MANIGTIASLANLTNTYDEILDHEYDEKSIMNWNCISPLFENCSLTLNTYYYINRKLYSKNFIINLLNYCHRINIKLIIKDHFSIDLIKEDLSFSVMERCHEQYNAPHQ